MRRRPQTSDGVKALHVILILVGIVQTMVFGIGAWVGTSVVKLREDVAGFKAELAGIRQRAEAQPVEPITVHAREVEPSPAPQITHTPRPKQPRQTKPPRYADD